MKITKKIKQTAIALSTALLITGVYPYASPAPTNCSFTVEAATKVKISKTKVTLKKGQKTTLKISGTTKKVTWSSSNKKVATVSTKGKITAKTAGTAVITATVSGKKYTCKVTVKKTGNTAVKVPSCAAEQTVYVTGYGSYYDQIKLPSCFIYIKNLDENAKITDIISSNPEITANARGDIDAIDISHASAGNLLGISSTISFKVTQNGKTYDLSCKIHMEKQEPVISSFKIGSQDIAKYCNAVDLIDGVDLVEGFKSDKKQKISIKMNPGYVFDYFGVCYKENGEYKYEKLKNNSYVNFTETMYIKVMYHTTKKPANYSESAEWWGVGVPSPLHNSITLDFNFFTTRY